MRPAAAQSLRRLALRTLSSLSSRLQPPSAAQLPLALRLQAATAALVAPKPARSKTARAKPSAAAATLPTPPDDGPAPDQPDTADATDASADASPGQIEPTMVPSTPLLQEIAEIQRQNPEHVLLVQVGSFFEIYDFAGNLDLIANMLGLRIAVMKLRKDPTRFAGFPMHSSRDYISILLRSGRTVALVHQVGRDELSSTKLLRRAVTRIITPGTVLEDDMNFKVTENSFLLSIFPLSTTQDHPPSSPSHSDSDPQPEFSPTVVSHAAPKRRKSSSSQPIGLAWIDVTTGEFFVSQCDMSSLESEINHIQPTEVIIPESARGQFSDLLEKSLSRFARPPRWSCQPSLSFTRQEAIDRFRNLIIRNNPEKSVLPASSSSSCSTSPSKNLLSDYTPVQIEAAAGVISYVVKNFPCAEPAFQPPVSVHSLPAMRIDPITLQALEIVRSFRERSAKGSLLGTIDYTKTAPGARLLSSRLKAPSIDLAEIKRRHDLVDIFYNAGELFATPLASDLSKCSDIERILQRMYYGTAGVADLRNMISTLMHVAAIRNHIMDKHILDSIAPQHRDALADLARRLGDFSEITDELKNIFAEDTVTMNVGGGIIAKGVSADLDTLLQEREALEDDRKELRNTLSNIFIENFTFHVDARNGPCLEFPKPSKDFNQAIRYMAQNNNEIRLLDSKRAHKRTHVRHELWVKLYARIVECDERIAKLETEIFREACNRIRLETFRLVELARALAEIDVSCAMAKLAADHAYVRPHMVDEPIMDVIGSRHAVVEHYGKRDGRMFIKNNVRLNDNERLWILTGPNMGGKSTFLRQCAHLAILAQAGSFVPADSATLGIVDAVYSRIGASDDISANASTFMVEMTETAQILAKATPRSLIVMDEVGRGTSTLDGLSLAYGIVRHLSLVNHSRALFATHYHELAHIAVNHRYADTHAANAPIPHVACYQASVSHDPQGHLQCRYEIVRGIMDKSHGIEVAEYAGLPPSVIHEAREFYRRMEHKDKS